MKKVKSSSRIKILKYYPLNIFKFQKVKEEGVYFFGGQEENGNINNEIRILKIGIKPCKWIIPETKGKKPEGRYLHSMHYMK